jgi:hypothetical protein
MYTRGVWHRDVSDGNMLISAKPSEGNVGFMIDFDYSLSREDEDPEKDTWTVSWH